MKPGVAVTSCSGAWFPVVAGSKTSTESALALAT